MSVIVRKKNDNKILLICKGADSIIKELLNEKYLQTSTEENGNLWKS